MSAADQATTFLPGEYVALVGSCTPEWLEYGSYRGWVHLDSGGCYLRDISEGDIPDDITWETGLDLDYERRGYIHAC